MSATSFVKSAEEGGPRLTASEAITVAKAAIEDLFKDEDVKNLGLEEVEFDTAVRHWTITLGFSRPWNLVGGAYTLISGKPLAERTYKVIRVDDCTKAIVSITSKS